MAAISFQTRAEVEAWILALGITNDGRPDWRRVTREAGLNLSDAAIYQVPSRWGKNKDQMRSVLDHLEKLDFKRKEPTEYGLARRRRSEWATIGRELEQVPELMDREIERLRPLAVSARKIAEGERARVDAFGSGTPTPKKPRK